jgi:hypothetical protein
MTPEQFCYWLQGFVEIRGSVPTHGEWEVIKDHLVTVFNKVTPQRINPNDSTKPEPIIGPYNPYVVDPLRTDPLRPYTNPGILPATIC